MKELLEAGVHFGHQTKRWNPKMKEYIFGERNGIYIIDLQKTLKMFKEASQFVADLAADGQNCVVCGHQAPGAGRDRRRSHAAACFYVNQRWLGGLLTNWVTVQKSVKRLQGTRRDGHGRPLRVAAQERSHQARARAQASASQPGRHQEHEPAAGRDLRDRFQQRSRSRCRKPASWASR